MKKLLRAALLVSTFSLLLFIGAVLPHAHAQAAEPVTNNVKSITNVDIDTNVRECFATSNPNLRTSVKDREHPLATNFADMKAPYLLHNVDGMNDCTSSFNKAGVGLVKVSCTAKDGLSDGKCSLTSATDGSWWEVSPNLFFGAGYKNYDSSRTIAGSADTGLNPTDFGTAANKDLGNNTDPGKCSFTDVFCNLLKLPGILLSGIAYLLLVLSTFILFMAGAIFNWVVIRTVFQFATYFGTSAGMLVAWTVMRDIANIALLFGFIFVGVATILNTATVEGFTAKRALPRLIIFAVLLNFSLFATQGVIDVANGFGSIFSAYAGVQCEQASTDGTGGQTSEECANVGLSGKIASAAGMNHFPTADGFLGALDKPYSTAAMLIVLSLLVTITAVVLLSASIMLVVRVVVLSLLMVTSPIGFAGLAIPGLDKIAKDWWHKLINQAFFAPIYLLMVFISLKLVDGLQDGTASIPDAITGNTAGGGTVAGNMQIMVVYAIVIGFMVASLVVAQKMGAAGASFAVNSSSALVYGSIARAGNLALGGAARGALALQRKVAPNNKTANRIANTAFSFAKGVNLDPRRAGGGRYSYLCWSNGRCEASRARSNLC